MIQNLISNHLLKRYIIGALALVLFLATFGLLTVPALAQETPANFGSLVELENFLGTDLPDDFDWENFNPVQLGPGFGAPSLGVPPGTVSCFDYYEFNSVDIQIRKDEEFTLAGDEQTFKVSLTNQNSYPLVDGSLYVKIFRARDDNIETQINGDDIVDSFIALEDVTLAGGGKGEYTFTWTPSRHLPTGEYYAAGYFITSDRFNLAGLSFTDDIIGGKGEFIIEGEESGVYFDKENVTVAGEDYQFISAPPRLHGENPVVVKAAIKNDTAEDAITMVYWNIYYWDAQREEHLVETAREAVTVPAGGSVAVDRILTDTQHAVYLIEPVLVYKAETVSKLNIRLVRDNVIEPRINFPALTSFPLAKGEETTLFSCLHNSGTDSMVDDTNLELVLTDEAGAEVYKVGYSGVTSGSMMAIAEKFSLDKNYNHLTLRATLKLSGQVVDEVSVVYDCNEIDSEQCLDTEETDVSVTNDSTLFANIKIMMLGVSALVLVLILWIVVILVKRKSAVNNELNSYDTYQ